MAFGRAAARSERASERSTRKRWEERRGAAEIKQLKILKESVGTRCNQGISIKGTTGNKNRDKAR